MQVDDRFKLLMHRVIARRLDEAAVDAARAWNADHDDGRDCRREWTDLLALPVDQLRRKLTERSETMTRLRLASPFPSTCDFTDEALRRRMWRLAKRQRDLDMVQIYDELMDVDVDLDNLPRNSALHRAGATVMRRNGFSEAEIVDAYGYSPDSIE